MADRLLTAPLAWHHFRFAFPAAWEVVGYGLKPTEGRLALADRDGEVMQVFWKKTDAPPNLERRLDDLFRANLPQDAALKSTDRRFDEFHGWRTVLSCDRALPFYAARHLPESGVILGVVFAPHPRRCEDVVRGVLSSWARNDGESRRWAAFGLDLTLPSALELDTVTSLPALQRMEFATRKGDRVILHRFGMLSAILEGTDPAGYFVRVKGRGTQVWKLPPSAEPLRAGVTELALRRRPIGWWSAPRRLPKEGKAWLWTRPETERLWAIEVWSHRDLALLAWPPSLVREP
ncbi:MAG: hypothetical protein IT578_00960 [Verrucomicrobiae bacterium]|nr:hypothetical protein [Verrucomicrobiae bacterium]